MKYRYLGNSGLAISNIALETMTFGNTDWGTNKKESQKIMDEYCPVILTIPGISYVTGAMIIGEIGEISLFNSPDKLTAFAGLDPCVYQSGQYNANSISISKRGSSYLSQTLL